MLTALDYRFRGNDGPEVEMTGVMGPKMRLPCRSTQLLLNYEWQERHSKDYLVSIGMYHNGNLHGSPSVGVVSVV